MTDDPYSVTHKLAKNEALWSLESIILSQGTQDRRPANKTL